MAIAVVQHVAHRTTSGTGGAINAITVTATGAGNLLVVGTRNDGAPFTTVSGVSDGSTAFTQFPSAAVDGTSPVSGYQLDLWYLPVSASGKTTITVTWGAAGNFTKDSWFWEVSGIATVATDGRNGVASGTASGVVMTGGAVTTTGTAGFLVGLCTPSNDVAANPKAGNEFSSGGDNLNGNGGVSLISSTAASHTPVWDSTTSSDTFVSLTAAFAEATTAVTRSLGSGSLVMAGLALSVFTGFNLAVPAGALAFTGLTPTLSVTSANSIAVPAGSLAFSSTAPQPVINQPIAVPAGSLVLAGQYVAIAFGGELAAGQLTFTGYAPSITIGGSLTFAMPAGSLAWTGRAPTVDAGGAISIPAGSLAFTSSAPTMDWGVGVPVGSLAFTGQAPVSSVRMNIDLPAGSLVLAGQTITIDAPKALAIAAGVLAFTGQALTVLNGGRLGPGDLTTQLVKWMNALPAGTDLNTRMRTALAALYGTSTGADLTTLLARFIKDRRP